MMDKEIQIKQYRGYETFYYVKIKTRKYALGRFRFIRNFFIDMFNLKNIREYIGEDEKDVSKFIEKELKLNY